MIQTTVRFSEEFNEKLRIEMARRRVRSLQQAVDESLTLWMEREPAAAEPAPAELAGATRDELAWCGKLLSLLREGDEASIDLVKHAVTRHQRVLRDRKKLASS
jgi:hypothetical protein